MIANGLSFKNLLLFSLLAIFVACDTNHVEEDDSRIGPNGVDQLEFGDLLLDVVALYGRPPTTVFLDGRNSFAGYAYSDTLRVLTLNGITDDSARVDAFRMGGDFSGMTREGIRLGLTIAEVEELIGDPHYVLQTVFRVYCKGDRFLQLGFFPDTLETIFYSSKLPGGNPPPC